MRKFEFLFVCAAVAVFIAAPQPASAVGIADLANDYLPAASLGQTSDDVGIDGTIGGTWHYFQETDGNPATSGDRALLTWQHDSDYENSERGYAGTSFEFAFNVPIISGDRLFDGPTPAPPAGTLMGHPSRNHFLGVEYRAHPYGYVDNLSIDYFFEKPNTFADARVVIYKNNISLLNAIIGNGAPVSGTLSGLGTLVPGESIWIMLGANGGFEGDQSWMKARLHATNHGIPEPSTSVLVAIGLAVAGCVAVRRRRLQ